MPEDGKNGGNELPTPEVLQPHGQKKSAPTPAASDAKPKKKSFFSRGGKAPKRSSYRPSHKATFIGLGVVVAILVINAVIITVVFQFQQNTEEEQLNRTEVTLTTDSLDQLGVSRNPVGNLGTELTVGPDAVFNGAITVGGNATVGGSLILNGEFSAAQGAFTELQGGETALTSLNVNEDITASDVNVRENLAVAGTSQLQGTVTISQLLTVSGNVNVAGNLAVGGTLSVRTLAVSALSIDTSLNLGGKIITRGQAPSVSAGGGVGSNGTVSISGTDTAGTVAVNIGVGGGNGVLANISFRGAYGATPRVVITSIGRSAGDYYVNRSASGFSIVTASALSPGGYAFDYIIVQ
jgi:hypothetical protein